MNAPFNEEDAPLDAAAERVRKKVVRLMAVSVGIMMVGLFAVFGAVYYKFVARVDKNQPQVEAAAPQPGDAAFQTLAVSRIDTSKDITGSIELPPGATIKQVSHEADRILVHFEKLGGAQALWIYDLGNNRVFARIDITQ